MYDAVASTSWFASIYFVSLVIIGNYVVLTLFLAILIDHFQNNDVRCGAVTRSPTVLATLSHRCSAGLAVAMPQEPDDDEALKQPLPSDHLGLLGARPDVATLVQQQRAQHEHRTNLAKVVAQALEQEQAALMRLSERVRRQLRQRRPEPLMPGGSVEGAPPDRLRGLTL